MHLRHVKVTQMHQGFPMIDYTTARFKTSDVARAAGIPAPTFRSYFSRQQFRVIGEMSKKADIYGLPNMFSLRDALGFAVAIRLISAGVEPKAAWKTAMLEYAHSGDEDRDPAAMFDIHEKGETLLVYWPDAGEGGLLPADDITSLHSVVHAPMHGSQEAAIIIVLNHVERRVFAALGVGTTN